MKRTVEITSEEFKEFVEPHRKKKHTNFQQMIERTEFLAENFANDHPMKTSLFGEIDDHIISSDYDRIIAKTKKDYFTADLFGQATPEYGYRRPRSVYDLGHVYKTLLMAIPCSQELKTKIRGVEDRIDALTAERRMILKTIKKDLGPLVHKETEDFVRKYIVTSDQAAGETE